MRSLKRIQLYVEAARVAQTRLETKQLADEWADDTKRLGAKLERVRYLAEKATSDWSKDYWARVSQQLERKIKYDRMQFQ